MPTIEVGGARVAYAESGFGETVLLLHSSASSGAQWRYLTESLQETYRFLAPDLYGYGETDAWPGQGPLGLAEEAALADADLGNSDTLHLVGHSYGGAVALQFALQHADRLRSLTLIEPVAFHLLRGATADILDSLTQREAKVLRMRFGIEMNTDHTLEEVGKQFDVTRERIRQIEAKALRKLRHPSRSEKLKSFLDSEG